MGILMSLYWLPREARVLMLGLDGAGKTTILNQVKLGETQTTVPTIGFNVESVKVEGLSLQIWDVGGQTMIRSLWDRYFKDADAVVFVIDSSDRERISTAKKELDELMSAFLLKDAVFLIFANKSDCFGSWDEYVLYDKLDLKRFQFSRRKIKVFSSNAKSGEGLLEGFMWLCGELRERITRQDSGRLGELFTLIWG